MNTIDYCELLKKEKNLKSTYALAKYLEVSQTTAKQWMKADIGFSVNDLMKYWIEMQRLREYELWSKRIIQYKFDFM